jgi:hypothetical protein
MAEIVKLVNPIVVRVPDMYRNQHEFYNRFWYKNQKVVAIELNLWQTPDGRLKRVYVNGIGPKGGKSKLGYFGSNNYSPLYSNDLQYVGQEDFAEQDWNALYFKAKDILDEAWGRTPAQLAEAEAEFQRGFDDYKVQLEASA